MKRKLIHMAFVLVMFAFLLSSFIGALCFPEGINEYENRKAEQLLPLSVQSYMDGSFQDSMEKSLTDQVVFSQDMKKTYNSITSGYMYNVIRLVSRIQKDTYIKLGGLYLYGKDHLLNGKHDFDLTRTGIDTHIGEYNRLFARYPEHEFYLYYIETDLDNSFDTGETNEVFDYLKNRVNLPETHMDDFSIDSFEEFDKYFYKTDHHWNAEGSYRGYGEVVHMLLSNDEPLLKPKQTVPLSGYYGYYSGSKTMDSVTASFREPFVANRFEFIPMSIYGNDARAPGYGNQEIFLDGISEKPLSYANFYGDDWGAVTIDTYQAEKETLLIISESFDNAILRLLATHFDRVISIDLRYFETYIGKKFSIDECLQKYDIDKVLLMGCADFFCLDEFSLEK